jgi:hypothetical protein
MAIIWTASSDAARPQACGKAAARWENAQAVAARNLMIFMVYNKPEVQVPGRGATGGIGDFLVQESGHPRDFDRRFLWTQKS